MMFILPMLASQVAFVAAVGFGSGAVLSKVFARSALNRVAERYRQ